LEGRHDAETMERSTLKRRKNFCAEGLDVRTKGEGSVKSIGELGLMRSLMWVRIEEATFTFSGVDWEAPFQ